MDMFSLIHSNVTTHKPLLNNSQEKNKNLQNS